MKSLILASSSPRRKEVMSLFGIPFKVIPPRIKENPVGNPVLTARKLAKEKAISVWKKHKSSLVVGADTLVYVGEKVIGKPYDEREAFRTLKFLSGRYHKVVTAVSFVGKGIRRTFHDVARVKFRKLTDEEILFYISTGEPMDKAGAYGVQGFGATFIERIEGDFYTVMGLPAVKVYSFLRKFLPL